MSVEFHCTRCSRLLRTPEGSSGRQTQCPECGETLTVPDPAPLTTPFVAAAPREVNPYQSPAATIGVEQAAPGELLPTQIELGDVLTRGWAIFQSQLGMVVLGVFLAGVLNNAPQWLSNIIIQVATFAQVEQAAIIALQVVLTIGMWAFQIWVTFGELAYLLHIARGGRPEIGMLFTGSRYFASGALATILFTLMVAGVALVCLGPAGLVYLATGNEDQSLIAFFVGLPFFVLAGAWLSLTYSYYQMAIVDRQCGPLESLSLSGRATQGNKLTLFALGLLMLVVNLAGLLACCIGVIFTATYSMLTVFAVAWLCITGQPTGDQYLLSLPASVPPPTEPPLPSSEPDSAGPPVDNPPST